MRLGIALAAGSRLCLAAAGGLAEAAPTMGWVEKIVLEPWGLLVKAKLDTGARTSSLQAENIDRFERDDGSWVRFTIEVETVGDEVRRVRVERPLVRVVRIEREGEDDRRPVVEMNFCLAGERRRAEFTLNDRDTFLYPVLLGRRFLDDVALVDAGREFLTEPDCGRAPNDSSDE